MKYLKICSFAVALLLFASPAMADLECELASENHDLRAESMHEPLDALEVRCTWDANDLANAGGTADEDIPMLSLDITFSTDVTNADDMQPYLEFRGNIVADDAASVNTKVMPSDIGSDDIEWEDVRIPTAGTFDTGDDATTWDAAHDWDDTNDGSGAFWIKGIYLDASNGDDEVTASIGMSVDDALATGVDFDVERGRVDVADIDDGMDLSFTPKNDNGKPGKPNACNPSKFTIAVDVEEGYRAAWMAENDIMLSLSSGSMEDKSKAGALTDTEEGGAGELIYEVANTRDDDTASLIIEINPAVGEEGDDITLTAQFLPMRRSGEKFVVSADLVVGTYAACAGDNLFFPFVTSMSGWDTGIVVVNDSKVDGSCYLNWGNMDLEDDEIEALSTIDVDAKDHMAFLVSGQRGADYSGSVKLGCTFKSATGYVFLSDAANGIGQGYLVKP